MSENHFSFTQKFIGRGLYPNMIKKAELAGSTDLEEWNIGRLIKKAEVRVQLRTNLHLIGWLEKLTLRSGAQSPVVPSPSQQQGGTPSQPLKPSPTSKSAWLETLIFNAKLITSGADALPFPYVKGVFGTVVFLLEAVEKVNKNQNSMKELCVDTVDIITILRDQISSHGDTAALKFKGQCEELEGLLHDVLEAVNQLKIRPQGFGARIKEVIKASNISEAEVPQPINICPPPSRISQGRQTILKQMHKYFSQKEGKRDIFVLHGLGGAGKTQIALKFIEQSASHFTNIFFIDSSTVETIETGLKTIAKTKSIGNSIQDALQWLRSRQEEWLLFFDNADDPKINLNKYFPQCTHGNILITSRNPGLCVYAGSHSSVPDMDETGAMNLLLTSAAQEITDCNRIVATQIVKVLYYLPLAIIQAGAFISKSGNLDSYLTLYEHNWAQLLSQRPVQTHDNYAWTVYTTWQISFEQLTIVGMSLDGSSDTQLASIRLLPHIVFLMQIISNVIPDFRHEFGKIYTYGGKLQKAGELHISVLRKRKHLLGEDHLDTLDAMGSLAVTYEKQGKLKEAEELGIAVLQKIQSILGVNHPHTLQVMGNLAVTYRSLGKLKEAEEIGIIILDRRKNLLGEDHPDTLIAMGNLALAYKELGRPQEAEELEIVDAEPLLLVVLKSRRTLLGDSHPHTAQAMQYLAFTYNKLEKWHKAEEFGVTALKKQTHLLGDNHPHTLETMRNLKVTYTKLGKLEEAKELDYFL
ncbi:P-loop containing nucleoside triphosphate hydrolase protein [Mycena epipterygia]|nr:P-loop containing nucleoside triphosphate hydrolase protein [Mycena epipterygia]